MFIIKQPRFGPDYKLTSGGASSTLVGTTMGRPRKHTGGVTITSIGIPDDTRRVIESMADEQRITISELVRPVLVQYFTPVPITALMAKLDAESIQNLALTLSEVQEANAKADAKAAQAAARRASDIARIDSMWLNSKE